MIETGVLFDNIHSFHNLNLVLSHVDIAPATPKTNYVDVLGGDGSLDLTEAHGEVKYGNRTHTFTFTVHPSDTKTFDEKITQVSNALNGKNFSKITLDRDSAYYWQGRCIVDEHKQDKRLKQVVVSAIVKPYKLKQNKTVVSVYLGESPTKINADGTMTVSDIVQLNYGKYLLENPVSGTLDYVDVTFSGLLAVEMGSSSTEIYIVNNGKRYNYDLWNSDLYSVVDVETESDVFYVDLTNGRKTVCPTITCTDDNTVIVFGDITLTLDARTYKILDICLIEGSNILKVSGIGGTVTFTYQEGDL